mmetsp:Transcript_8019/g.11021  ORF Transcript_8019/g.11021 Transcript_8019/m.11021 type:complete len:110 (-) Transcript_8019:361-690(-)|eukprot:CAMPEP_0185255644 /NCGR_PEP_ID=MMETSP1359-20130426/4728_1 /TAXON_ID=552665 /ORGANISM="Bigelowiella longifila, Strain CCMP242" /LENGTH=109 /DNA_ID=CAMNT_0027839743 /DNA_START=92 /DNA_END=424 /DNA_ORIENTATION=-
MEDELTIEKGADQEEGKKDKQPMLALPAPSDAKRLETNTVKLGENVKFDELGPVVINSNGTISRIANWDRMTEIEKETTYRVLVKRNNLRRKRLLEQQEKSKQKISENS